MGEIKRGIQTSTLDLGPSHPMGPIAYNIYYIIYIYIHIIGKYTGKKGGNGVKGNGFLSLSLSLYLSLVDQVQVHCLLGVRGRPYLDLTLGTNGASLFI